ncbi:response regulator transcription factor [Frankia sp. AiPs1]|uniref:response regulator transcription factor n=1 Tax=Frankia sp. AiPs1 TaxID=573493 RepID=UPI002044A5EF|nr:response regulator transcription factor [Frankia sp. AiPs1]
MDADTVGLGQDDVVAPARGSSGTARSPEPGRDAGRAPGAQTSRPAVWAPIPGGHAIPDGELAGDPAAGDGAGTGEPSSADAPRRVVVVDDADGVRELLCLLLGAEPDFVVVGAAANGAEAIDEVVRTAPDLVLLDLAMPVLDGLGALPRIRRVAPHATVVIFTGFSEDALLDRVLALGADALLEKGLATGPLVDQLRSLCAARRPG